MPENSLVDTRGFEEVLQGSFPSFSGDFRMMESGGMFTPSGADPKNPSGGAFDRDKYMQDMLANAETNEEKLKLLEMMGNQSDMQVMGDLVKQFNDPKFIKDRLDANLAFEKERMAQAAPYKLLFNIPNQMMNVAAMELAGAGKYAQIMDAGIARMPNLSPSAVNVTRNPSKYF